ncbi:hypothetical protein V2J79_22330 [Pseudomonas alliivorans]|nr:hypothetical protein [Pseudomonas alliivorans]MEE5071976.1 hypothetical protein [Pseudomonas alliivorans]
MHWILAVTLTTGPVLLGKFDDEETCQKALQAFWRAADSTKKAAACVQENSRILRLFER